MGFSCDFADFTFNHGETLYGCHVVGKQTPENRDLVVTGRHINGKNNKDVVYIKFEVCTVVKIPQGLRNSFPNLQGICITNSKLKKVNKDDLTEYKNLKKFVCVENELEFLPGDLFEGFRNLEYIHFEGNELVAIEPNILDGLNKLKHVSFVGNTNYDTCFSVYPVNEPNASLQQVKNDLREKYFTRFKFLEDLRKSERSLQQKNQELNKLQSRLTTENQNMKKVKEDLTDKLIDANASNFSLKEENKALKAMLDKQSFQSEDIKAFIKDDNTKDFKIVIDDQEFPVHKFLLAARSPVLAEILKNNPEVENLNLVDISVQIFEQILKFLYTDELPGDDGTNFLHLFAAAGKLKIAELMNHAATKVIEQIDVESAVDIFKLGYKYDNIEMRQKAFDKIKEKYPKIEFKDEWAVDPDKVTKIIEIFMKKEEAMRKIEEEFAKSISLDL